MVTFFYFWLSIISCSSPLSSLLSSESSELIFSFNYWTNRFSIDCWVSNGFFDLRFIKRFYFQSLLAKEQLASQPSISRLWNRLSQENISQLQEVNQILIDKVRTARNTTELIARHEVILTNLAENISAEAVFQTYSKRGILENYIKEAKNGFYFNKTDSPRFS